MNFRDVCVRDTNDSRAYMRHPYRVLIYYACIHNSIHCLIVIVFYGFC